MEKNKGCLATFAKRKIRFYIVIKISDRGKEFACWKEVKKMRNPFYFADAYSAWKRGTNENSNGLLRKFYPKKTDLEKISETELKKVLNLLNSRPRKCLNYVTNREKFLYELEKL